MIRSLVACREARLGLLVELSRCWNMIRVSQHLLGHLKTDPAGATFAKARRHQLARQAVAIVHADRAEDRLAALPAPYSIGWLEGRA